MKFLAQPCRKLRHVEKIVLETSLSTTRKFLVFFFFHTFASLRHFLECSETYPPRVSLGQGKNKWSPIFFSDPPFDPCIRGPWPPKMGGKTCTGSHLPLILELLSMLLFHYVPYTSPRGSFFYFTIGPLLVELWPFEVERWHFCSFHDLSTLASKWSPFFRA